MGKVLDRQDTTEARLRAVGFSEDAIRSFGKQLPLVLDDDPAMLADFVLKTNAMAHRIASGQAAADQRVVDVSTSLILSVLPGVGELKDLQEAWTGTDLITGDRLSGFERTLALGAALVPVISGTMLRGGSRAAGVAINEGEEVITLYRGTSYGLETAIHGETGMILSDAARTAFMETGSIEKAMATSDTLHAQAVVAWGDEVTYAQGHSAFGLEVSDATGIPRTLISWTSDLDVAKSFAGASGKVYVATVPVQSVIQQTLEGAGEAEYLIRSGVEARLLD